MLCGIMKKSGWWQLIKGFTRKCSKSSETKTNATNLFVSVVDLTVGRSMWESMFDTKFTR